MGRKVLARADSGTCNVCSAPCSSCMHLKLASVGPKSYGISDENCHITARSHRSVSRACDSLHHTTSEASNLLSVNSSHDSLSENAESKANTRCSDIADALDETDMLPGLAFGRNGATDQLSAQPECMVDRKSFSNGYQKVVKVHDDNTSCVSRVNEASSVVNLHSKNVDRKNLSCSSVLVSILGSNDSGKAFIAPKSELIETPSSAADAANGSTKVQSGCLSVTAKVPHIEEDIKDGMSDCSIELPDIHGHALHSVSADGSDESETVEHDVKVCDICGDAGLEDLLAICSKCSDGAEHTYCMRQMLQKVPEGDWLCEECKLAEEKENRMQDAEGKRIIKGTTKHSMKRHIETHEAPSVSKRQAIETGFGLPKSSSPTRTDSLSRDSSFKGLDKGKAKLAHQASYANHSGLDVQEITGTSSDGPQLQMPRGTLLKSNSFNSFNYNLKSKLVDEVPQKQKSSRDLDMKEGTSRMMSKSLSFRSVTSGRSNATESKVKMLSSTFSQARDIRGLKQVRDPNALERKSLSRLERPLGNSRELKTSQSDGKLRCLSRSTSSLVHKGAETRGSNVRSLLTNGMSSTSTEQKLNEASPKDELSSGAWIADLPSNGADENLQDGSSRSRESSNQSDKTRESSVLCSRPCSTTGLKTVTCYKCQGVGHTAEVCSISGTRASGADSSATKNAREDMSKVSKLKAAIEAAMLKKPGILRKKKESDDSDVTSEMAFHDQTHDMFLASNKTRKMVFVGGRDEGQAKLGSCSSETVKQINGNNVQHRSVHSTDSITSVKVGDSDSVVRCTENADNALTAKPHFLKILPIPEHEYIWQGALEVHRDGKFLDVYNGIQAHLSTFASPKVIEMVNQVPHKIVVNEVPRLSTWPRQFHENGAEEDNIALYFFAKDIESYEESYKNLVDCMIQRDMALEVSFDGVELLIFPSTQLPQRSQRWNTLFFLWGVFRGRRSSDLTKKPVFPSCNVVPLDMNSIDKPCTALNGDHDNPVSIFQLGSKQQKDRLDFKSFPKNATNSAVSCSDIRQADPPQEEIALPECRLDLECKASAQVAGTTGGSYSRTEIQKHVYGSFAREDPLPVKVCKTSKEDEGGRRIVDEEKIVVTVNGNKCASKLERVLNEHYPSVCAEVSSGIDVCVKELDCEQSDNRKRSYLYLSEVPRTSNGTTQKFPWMNSDDNLVDERSIKKRCKIVPHEQHGFSSLRDGTSSNNGFAARTSDLGSSSSLEGRSSERPVDEKVIHEDLGATERYFFPVTGGYSMPWNKYSSDDENQLRKVVPNLELALGAETKPPDKGIMPFFVSMVEKNNTGDKTPDKVTVKEEDDGDSTSLSLSLAFPFPSTEQTVKPVSKTEQLLPERRHVNTSLLLFGAFSDK